MNKKTILIYYCGKQRTHKEPQRKKERKKERTKQTNKQTHAHTHTHNINRQSKTITKIIWRCFIIQNRKI